MPEMKPKRRKIRGGGGIWLPSTIIKQINENLKEGDHVWVRCQDGKLIIEQEEQKT